MRIAAEVFTLLVALLHIYFMALEMFFWTKPLGLKTFRNTPEFANASKVLAANQGLYNGFLSAGLFFGLWHSNAAFGYAFSLFFLTCVIVAGIFGGLTVSRKIFFVQAVPALIAAALLLGS